MGGIKKTILVISFYGATSCCMHIPKEILTLKKSATKTILNNLTSYPAQALHKLPNELIQEILDSGLLTDKVHSLLLDKKCIGTIKITSLPVDTPRIVQGYKSRYTNLVVCASSVRFDRGERRISLFRLAKKQTYSLADLQDAKPLATLNSPWEPVITCLAVHPQLPIITWGANDGTVSLLIIGYESKKELYAYALHGSGVDAIGFDTENNCVVSCDMNKNVCIWPFNHTLPTIKIEKAHALTIDNPIADAPVYINNRINLPFALLHPQNPLFNDVILELAIIKKLLKQKKSTDAGCMQRILQAKNYVNSLEIDASSCETVLSHINRAITEKAEKEQEDAQPLWLTLQKTFKKHFNS